MSQEPREPPLTLFLRNLIHPPDPSNWMGHAVALGAPFRYRYVVGDTTDLLDDQDDSYINDLIR